MIEKSKKKKGLLGLIALLACTVTAGVGALASGNGTALEADAAAVTISQNVAKAENATVTVEGDDTVVNGTAGTAYSGEIPYILEGNSSVTFDFPNTRTATWVHDNYALNFVYDISSANGDSIFQVVYKSDHRETMAYVQYGTEVRSFSYHVNEAPWYSPDGFYMYSVPKYSYSFCAPYMFGSVGEGTMEIKFVDEVVQVWVTYDMSKGGATDKRQMLLAAFDGSDVGFAKPTARVTLATENPGWGLPKIYDELKDGYKVSFSCSNVSSTNEQVDVDVKFTSVVADKATLDTRKVTFAIGKADGFENCGVGSEIVIPAATWTSPDQTEPTEVTSITVVRPTGVDTVSAGDTYVIKEAGVHKIVYAAEGESRYLKFTAKEFSISALDRFEATGAVPTLVKTEKDTGVLIASSEPYSVALDGLFFGDTQINFRFTENYVDYLAGFFAFRVTDALDESKFFEVEYSVVNTWSVDDGTQGYTGAHLKYGEMYRSSRYWGTEWYNTRKTGHESVYCGPNILNRQNETEGSISFDFDENGVLSVLVSSFRDTSMRVIGAFDGTDTFVSGESWGLPKLPFENGYKISFYSSFNHAATEDKASDVCIKSIVMNGSTLALDQKYLNADYAFRAEFDGVAQAGEEIWLPCGEALPSAKGVYSIVLGSGEWVQKIVPLTVSADTSAIGDKTLSVSDNSYADVWKAVTKDYTVHVEEAYTLTFDTNGGFPIDPIVYSEHTKDRVAVNTAEKHFWEFDGWYLGTEEFSGDLNDLYGQNVTLVAHWKDVTPPVISLANGVSDLTVALKNGTVVISNSDVQAEDAAQNDSVTVAIEVKTPNGSFVSVQSGDSLVLSETGIYTVRYVATDAEGFTAEILREIRTIDRKSPTLTVEEEAVRETFAGMQVKVASVTAKAADGAALNVALTVTKDGKTVSVANGGFTASETGEYTVTYTATDSFDLVGIYTYTVSVNADTVAPVITVALQDREVAKGTRIEVPAANVSDNVAEGIVTNVTVAFGVNNVAIVDGGFTATHEGTYIVTYTATDKAGNQAQKTVYITVKGESSEPEKDDGKSGCNASVLGVSVLAVIGAAAVVFMKKKEN